MKGLGIFFFILCLFVSNQSKAGQNETQTMTYDVFAGGIHALDATLTITTNAKTYDTELSSATHGFLHTLAPWSGVFSAKGNVGKDRTPYPLEHASSSTWKRETEEKQYTYDGKGNFISYKVTETKDGIIKDKTPKKVDPELTRDTTDLLSATLNLLMVLPEKPECTGESLIFDGDRNFKLAFKGTTAETLKKTRYNIYEGDAVSCQVEVVPDKGKWRKKPRGWLSIQEQGRKKGSLPVIWLGKMDGAESYIPVKIRVKTDYGTLFLHLTSYKKDML